MKLTITVGTSPPQRSNAQGCSSSAAELQVEWTSRPAAAGEPWCNDCATATVEPQTNSGRWVNFLEIYYWLKGNKMAGFKRVLMFPDVWDDMAG